MNDWKVVAELCDEVSVLHFDWIVALPLIEVDKFIDFFCDG